MSDQNRPTDPSDDSSDEVSGYGLNVPLPIPSRTSPPAATDVDYTTTDASTSLAGEEYKGEPMPLPSGKKPPEKDGGPTF